MTINDLTKKKILKVVVLFWGGLELYTLLFYWWAEKGESARLLNSDPYKILVLGESLTQGGEGLGHRFSFPGQIELSLNRVCQRPVVVINGGVAGAQSGQILEHLKSRLQEDRFDLVVSMLGINDVMRSSLDTGSRNLSFQYFFENLSLIRLLRSFYGNAISRLRRVEKVGISIDEGLDIDDWSFETKVTEPLKKAGDLEYALDYHKQILKKTPSHSWAQYGIGRIYQGGEPKDRSKGIPYFKGAIAAAEGRNWYLWFKLSLAELYWSENLRQEFSGLLEEIASDPKLLPFQNIRIVEILLKAGEKERALQFLERARKRFPSDAKLAFLLSELHSSQASLKLATELAEEGQRLEALVSTDTFWNYRELARALGRARVPMVALQYPRRSPLSLEKILDGIYPAPNVKVFSSKPALEEVLNEKGYNYFFMDRVGGNFGHFTQKGNEWFGDFIARKLKMEIGDLSAWCGN